MFTYETSFELLDPLTAQLHLEELTLVCIARCSCMMRLGEHFVMDLHLAGGRGTMIHKAWITGEVWGYALTLQETLGSKVILK